MGPRQQPTILRHRPSLSLTMLYPEIMIGIGVYLPGSNLISSITVPNEEQEEKRQQHIILCRIFQTIDESEQCWWWFRSWQICVLGSEGKSSIIVHQGFPRIMMKNVAINKSAFDYYLYMNFICKYKCFFQIIFLYFCEVFFVVDSLTFKFDGRLGRLVPTSTSSQHQQRESSC
jgi:hypothetical protein